MTSGFTKHIPIFQVALLLASLVLVSDCWIPLPEETAIVVEVLDARGGPVNDVSLTLDGSITAVTGSQRAEGQVFISLDQEGDHTVQLDTATLIDPQGGIGWVPLASQISGELVPLSYDNRPFAGGSKVLIVPVNKGEITVATIYLDDIQKAPMDNQWLTDGLDTSNDYRTTDSGEFTDSPSPTFWWRQDPSLGDTVNYTFQFWEDDDGDTRFPLGITNHVEYNNAMNSSGAGYIQPDWQVPLAGVQRAEAAPFENQIVLWSSQASETPVKYDLYYAPTSLWTESDWEKYPVLRDIIPETALDGAARKFTLGTGTMNPGLILKNGIQYTVALRTRDAASNLDIATGQRSTRRVTPTGSAPPGAAAVTSAVADSVAGGSIDLTLSCLNGDTLRIYAAPGSDFNKWPFDTRFIRNDTYLCGTSPNPYRLGGLVNGVTYAVGVEPFDASGNVGTASSTVFATPSSASAGDTMNPVFSGTGITVNPDGNGQVTLNISAVADSDINVFRRVYWSPVSFTSNEEAMMFTDLGPATPTSIVLFDIPNDIPYYYRVRGIDSFGNSSIASTQFTLSEPDTTGPTWVSDDPSFYSTISYAPGTTTNVWDLGATWSYGSGSGGFALGLDPAQGQGEYVWRIIQENPVRGISRATKLSAFYTWSGYYYVSTEGGGLDMSVSGPWGIGGGPSQNADHRDVLSFVEGAPNILSADVMGTPFDSVDSSGYRQRTSAQFSASLAAGSGTTNQLTILYNTDEDGQAFVGQGSVSGFLGQIRVLATNKQRPLPTPEPHLQSKEFRLSYFTTDDELVNFPPPTFGGSGIFFSGTLDEPDYQDPLW
jgi:hypothetical protein